MTPWTSRPSPNHGSVTIAPDSSLRKLMRAAHRSKLPDERLGLIEHAQNSAASRRKWPHGQSVYANSPRKPWPQGVPKP